MDHSFTSLAPQSAFAIRSSSHAVTSGQHNCCEGGLKPARPNLEHDTPHMQRKAGIMDSSVFWVCIQATTLAPEFKRFRAEVLLFSADVPVEDVLLQLGATVP